MQVLTKAPIFLLIISLTAISCKKEGPAGPAGKDGNADVTVFNYPSREFTEFTNYDLPGISQGKIDSSIVLLYYNRVGEPETSWYPAPGIGPGRIFEARCTIWRNGAIGNYRLQLNLLTLTGAAYTTLTTFRKTRIFIVPANNIVNVNGRIAGPDLKDYYAVKEYYKIPD